LESGLRSFDRSMPEEINRILIDNLSDIFFVTEDDGQNNLIREGVNPNQIYFVGNTMIDTMVAFETNIDKSIILEKLKINSEYALLTFHRPSNVDDKYQLTKLSKILTTVSDHINLIFSIHPRTMKRLEEFNLLNDLTLSSSITIVNSLGYLDFIKLVKNSRFVLTDSGGIQEETSFLNVPCLTVRENTERPSTIKLGTNNLIQLDEIKIINAISKLLRKKKQPNTQIPLWDGKSTERIVQIINNLI